MFKHFSLSVLLLAGFLVAGTPETPDNDEFANASPLVSTEDPAGSGVFFAYGDGAVEMGSDVDHWQFDAIAGDQLTIAIATPDSGLESRVSLHNAAGDSLISDYLSGPGRDALIEAFTIPSSGKYTIRVSALNGYTTGA